MKRQLCVPHLLKGSLVALIAVLLLNAATAAAQTQPQPPTQSQQAPSPTPVPTPEPPSIFVSTTSPLPLVVNGLESDKLPTQVLPGATVCISDGLHYKTEGERWIFQQWSTGSTQECIAPTRAGAYRAMFAHEVLVVVRSVATAFQHSEWVSYGVPLELEVPPTATARDDGLSRYRFLQWSDGETPFQTKNTIAPVKPTVLDVKWALEHRVTVNGPGEAQIKGTGWYADGSNLVLQAPDLLPGAQDRERSKFGRWQTTGFPSAVIANATAPQAMLKVDAPYTVQAVFDKQYFVSARTPAGTLKRDWVNDGQELVIEAPAILEVIPERERLVFKRWDGVDGIQSPRFGGPVDRPVAVTAVYEREVMLKVDAPFGVTGDGWRKAGSVAMVSVPATTSTMLLTRSIFAGFSGYPADQASVQVLMSEPVVLTALYRTEIDLYLLGVLLLVPFAAVVVILSYRWVPAVWRAVTRMTRRSPAPASEATAPVEARRNGAHKVGPLQHKQV